MFLMLRMINFKAPLDKVNYNMRTGKYERVNLERDKLECRDRTHRSVMATYFVPYSSDDSPRF